MDFVNAKKRAAGFADTVVGIRHEVGEVIFNLVHPPSCKPV
jgi:hypothetical protein